MRDGLLVEALEGRVYTKQGRHHPHGKLHRISLPHGVRRVVGQAFECVGHKCRAGAGLSAKSPFSRDARAAPISARLIKSRAAASWVAETFAPRPVAVTTVIPSSTEAMPRVRSSLDGSAAARSTGLRRSPYPAARRSMRRRCERGDVEAGGCVNAQHRLHAIRGVIRVVLPRLLVRQHNVV